MKRVTEFGRRCAAINKRLHDKPGKTETHRLYRKLFKPGLASRVLRGELVYFCTECGCSINPIGQHECPQCHAKWTEKKTVELHRRRVDTEAAQHYPEHMGKMLTIDLTSTNLTIRPLQSVDEFKEEAEHMHHCVYRMGYWNYFTHPSSLILSAKDDNGKRLATIEYNMASNTIVQCRAACNAVPERDKEIRKLITDNKAEFVKLEKKPRAQAKAA